MCGIAGVIGRDNTSQHVKNMLEAMHHRGPDDWGIFEEEGVVLGHKRLSIIDLSPAGHQPMTNRKGDITIIFNGEIYNYQELKSLLPEQQTHLKSTTDTEVILELWATLGKDILPKLRGMFALAVWNASSRELILARDQMGIKPLYYQIKNNQLVFASEMKGMLASGLVEKNINNKAVYPYLANGYIMQPDTIIEDVQMLEPASCLIWEDGHFAITKYWSISNKPDSLPQSEDDAINKVNQLLTDAVREEAIADRPLGVFLSGGLDSTVLVAALRKSGANQIKTFSVGFDGDDLSEEDDAREAAAFYGTTHTQLQVNDKDVVPYIEQYIKALDQPSVDGLNTWLVSKVTAKHVTVALSGLGGDELFSGYSIDRAILYKQPYAWISQIIYLTKVIWNKAPKNISNLLLAYSNWRNLPEFYKSWGRLFNDKEINELTKRKSSKQNQFIALDLGPRYSLLQRISYMHQRGFMMSRLLRDSDAVSMDHSIEVRFPLIDCRLVNLVFSIPDSWKVKNVKATAKLSNYEKQNSYEVNGVKHLLYQSYKKDLPPKFGSRSKRGFKMPIEIWMRNGLKYDIEQTLTNNASYLNSDILIKMNENWKSHKVGWSKVWAIYILEKWVQQNLK
jgi:asparagine synthase (glutamine-hydrolysing)